MEEFYKSLSDNQIEAKPAVNITSSIFSGTSFDTDNSTKPEDILALPQVANIWPVRRVPKPTPQIHNVGTAATEGAEKWTSHGNFRDLYLCMDIALTMYSKYRCLEAS